MNVFLWIVAAVLAAAFVLAGLMKATQPKDKLERDCRRWRTSPPARSGSSASRAARRPRADSARRHRHRPAADAETCLAVVMVLAATTHIRRKEPSGVGVNAVLLVLVSVVAWGRFGPYGW